jgi:hypothetical protein
MSTLRRKGHGNALVAGPRRRAKRWAGVLLATGGLLSAMLTTSAASVFTAAPAHAAGPTALIDGDTTAPANGSTESEEQLQAEALGFTVTVVTGAQWDAMTAAQFRAYQLLIIADPRCVTGRDYLASAISNASVWGGAVLASGGQVAINGTDPSYHSGANEPVNAPKLINAEEAFAGANVGATGAYVSLGCSDAFTPIGTTIPLLDALTTQPPGTWKDDGLNGEGLCEDNVKIIAFSGPTAGLTDDELSNWSCSAHESFSSFPSDYVPLAIALDATNKNVCATVSGVQYCGGPYVLVRGAVTHTSNLTLTPATQSLTTGGSATITGTVKNNNVAEAGKTVTFTVISGPNLGATGTGTTNGSGQATFTYPDTGGVGTDTIQATFVDDSGATETSNQVTVTWAAGTTDTTAPSCALTGVISGPPKQIEITVQDTGSGLGSVVVTTSTNATTPVPAFTVGTTAPVVVTATKVDQSAGAEVALKVTDVAGNVTNCDPLLTTVARGDASVQTYTGIPRAESRVLITNGNPGLRTLTVTVNGTAFKVSLASGATRKLNVSSAMHAGKTNVIRFQGRGPKGSSADVVLHD